MGSAKGHRHRRGWSPATSVWLRENKARGARRSCEKAEPSVSRKPPAQKVCDFLADFLCDVKLKNRLNTYKLRVTTINKHVNPFIGGVAISRLTSKHIRDLLIDLKRADRTDKTVRTVYVTLHTAFESAVQRGELTRNPCKGCPVRKAKPKPRTVLDLEEVQLFLETARKHSRHYEVFVLGCTAAMWEGQILALQWEDVNLEKGWLDVRFTLTEDENGRLVRTEPKTAKSRRRIFLCRLAIDALREQRRTGVGSGFVFTAEHGGPIWKLTSRNASSIRC